MQVLNLQGNRVFGHSDNAPGATRQNSLSLIVSDVRRSASGSDLRKSITFAQAKVSKLSTTVDQDNITPKDKEPSNSVRFFNAIFNLLCICSELFYQIVSNSTCAANRGVFMFAMSTLLLPEPCCLSKTKDFASKYLG